MSRATICVAAERKVDAPAEHVYGYIAGYREHHHRFLPPAFSDYRVEQGGVGGHGGAVLVDSRRPRPGLSGTNRRAGPRPVLTDSDTDTGTVATFILTPDDRQSLVRIETVWSGAGGLAGLLERLSPRDSSAGCTRTSWPASTNTPGSPR